MRKGRILQTLVLLGVIFSGMTTLAQSDSTQHLPDKKLTKLLAKISEDSTKLVKFNGMISQFEKDKNDAAKQAQQSADDNKTAADRLADNPQDKKLAKKAHSAAKDAKNDSDKAREASEKLDDLNKDIKKLTKQLEKERSELDKYQASLAPPPAAQQ